MPGQQTIDPRAYVLKALGIPIVQFKKGTMITIKRDSKAFDDDVSADGIAVRIRNADQRGSIEFVLDQASPSNDALSARLNLDSLTGTASGPTIFKDLKGTTVCSAANSWLEKLPDSAFGTENESRTWVIRCANLTEFIGGTTPV